MNNRQSECCFVSPLGNICIEDYFLDHFLIKSEKFTNQKVTYLCILIKGTLKHEIIF